MSKFERLVILGAGRQGAETADIGTEVGMKNRNLIIMGFIDDHTTESQVNGFPVLGGIDEAKEILNKFPGIKMIAAIGEPRDRQTAVKRYSKLGFTFTNLVHPTAQISESVKLETGITIAAGCVITVDVKIGNHVIINPLCSIAHDVEIGAFSTINAQSAISGNNFIGEGVYLGVGAKTIQGITIGEWTLVGAGSVVTKNLPPNVVAVGVPAKVIKTIQ